MPREAGDRVGRYIIDRRLGAGGMAEAYLAHHEGIAGFKKPVVVKLLHAWHAQDPKNVELFLKEARVGGRLNHANIIQIFDLGEEGNQHYIAMEYVNGLTLLQATKRCWALGQGIPIDVAVRVVSAAALGLHHAHTLRAPDGSEAGIVHRDVSPDNIMIAKDGTVKVLDFGVARIGGAEATRSGDIKGKIPFMPPEQLAGDVDVDRRVDIWALGVTLYWCLSGKRPFASGNDALTMYSIVHDVPASLRSLNPRVSAEIDAVVMQCLEKEREKRIPTAHKLATTLNKLVPATQENPVAKFIERMRLFDDDPPEKRGPRNTGGWPAVSLPLDEQTDVPLPDLTSQVHELTNVPAPVAGVASNVEEDAPPLDKTAALADVTLEDGLHPGADVGTFDDGANDDIPSTVRIPAKSSALPIDARRARWMAAAAGIAFVTVLAIALVALSDDEKAPARRSDVVAAAPVDVNVPVVAEKPVETAEPEVPEVVEPVAAPEEKPKSTKTVPVFVMGPPHVKWLSTSGKLLGEGTRSINVPEGDKSIVAYDVKREGRVSVALGGRIDFDRLPKGKLQVKVVPYATNVKLGNDRLGPTPVYPVDVAAGTYKLVVENNRNVVVKTIRVKAGVDNVVTVDAPAK